MQNKDFYIEHLENTIKDLPVREVLCSLVEEDQYCEQCNTKLKVLGKKVVREELEYIPAKLRIVRYIQLVYECPKCKHTTYPYIVKAPTPSSLMNHSLASPSSVANVMYKKVCKWYATLSTGKRLGAIGNIFNSFNYGKPDNPL